MCSCMHQCGDYKNTAHLKSTKKCLNLSKVIEKRLSRKYNFYAAKITKNLSQTSYTSCPSIRKSKSIINNALKELSNADSSMHYSKAYDLSVFTTRFINVSLRIKCLKRCSCRSIAGTAERQTDWKQMTQRLVFSV